MVPLVGVELDKRAADQLPVAGCVVVGVPPEPATIFWRGRRATTRDDIPGEGPVDRSGRVGLTRLPVGDRLARVYTTEREIEIAIVENLIVSQRHVIGLRIVQSGGDVVAHAVAIHSDGSLILLQRQALTLVEAHQAVFNRNS